MTTSATILLCGNRMALPVMRNLLYQKQLAAVIIPEKCKDFAAQVKILLHEKGVPILTVNKNSCNDVLATTIKKYKVAMGLVVTFSYKLPSSIYTLPVKGFFNIHPGPLPEFRGPDPVFQQIKQRMKTVGVTIHKIDDGLDTGEIVLTDSIPLQSTDVNGVVVTKLGELAAKMVDILMKISEFGSTIPSRKQDETKAIYYNKQGLQDVTINWQTMSADAIIALINACNPWNKGAATSINGLPLKIIAAEKQDEKNENKLPAGSIVSINKKSISVSVINDEMIEVQFIYIEEGFMITSNLQMIGIKTGHLFK